MIITTNLVLYETFIYLWGDEEEALDFINPKGVRFIPKKEGKCDQQWGVVCSQVSYDRERITLYCSAKTVF